MGFRAIFQAPVKPARSHLKATRKPPNSHPVGTHNGILALRYRCGCLPGGLRVALRWLGGGFRVAYARFPRASFGWRGVGWVAVRVLEQGLAG
jgi:hypothetical protein